MGITKANENTPSPLVDFFTDKNHWGINSISGVLMKISGVFNINPPAKQVVINSTFFLCGMGPSWGPWGPDPMAWGPETKKNPFIFP